MHLNRANAPLKYSLSERHFSSMGKANGTFLPKILQGNSLKAYK